MARAGTASGPAPSPAPDPRRARSAGRPARVASRCVPRPSLSCPKSGSTDRALPEPAGREQCGPRCGVGVHRLEHRALLGGDATHPAAQLRQVAEVVAAVLVQPGRARARRRGSRRSSPGPGWRARACRRTATTSGSSRRARRRSRPSPATGPRAAGGSARRPGRRAPVPAATPASSSPPGTAPDLPAGRRHCDRAHPPTPPVLPRRTATPPAARCDATAIGRRRGPGPFRRTRPRLRWRPACHRLPSAPPTAGSPCSPRMPAWTSRCPPTCRSRSWCRSSWSWSESPVPSGRPRRGGCPGWPGVRCPPGPRSTSSACSTGSCCGSPPTVRLLRRRSSTIPSTRSRPRRRRYAGVTGGSRRVSHWSSRWPRRCWWPGCRVRAAWRSARWAPWSRSDARRG